jgi:DNA-directed RNA polymerase specialized sigma24 family protein
VTGGTDGSIARDRAWLALVTGRGRASEEALDGLMKAYDPGFLRFLKRLRLDVEDAEDVLVKMWTELATGGLRYDPDRVPAWWLKNVLKKRVQRFFASEAHERERRRRWQAEIDDNPVSPGADRMAQLKQFADTLNRLQGDQLEALELIESFHDQGKSIDEVAFWRYEQCRQHHCDCETSLPADCRRGSISATRKALSRARQSLQRLLHRFI